MEPQPSTSASPLSAGFTVAGEYASKAAIYLGALTAGVVAVTQLKKPLDTLTGQSSWLALAAVVGIPIICTLAVEIVPAWLRRKRDRRLADEAIRGELVRPGYFRIYPYEDSAEDRAAFCRSDGAHRELFKWIHESEEHLLFLTGRSGAGKSSILNAYVIPTLRESNPEVVGLVVRSFANLGLALTNAVCGLGGESADRRSEPPLEAIRNACRRFAPRRIVLILDQFEEFILSLQGAGDTQRQLIELLIQLGDGRIPNLKVVVSFRTDYLGPVQSLGLPALRQLRNWREVAPFTEADARKFFRASGLVMSDALLDRIVRNARDIEETEGLIRPVTINMIGLVLSRRSVASERITPNFLQDYVKQCITMGYAREHAPRILATLITSAATKQPRATTDVSKIVNLPVDVVTGCLLILGNEGLVRRLDDGSDVWEISHDFLAERAVLEAQGDEVVLASFFGRELRLNLAQRPVEMRDFDVCHGGRLGHSGLGVASGIFPSSWGLCFCRHPDPNRLDRRENDGPPVGLDAPAEVS